MGLNIWLKWVPVFSLSKQQPSEPRVKRVHPTSRSHEKKAENGWGSLWEPKRVASHPMVILMKLEGVFWVETTMCSASKARGKGSGTLVDWHRMDPCL